MSANNGIVITGMGVVSPVGSGREDFLRAIGAGESGLRSVSLFDAAGFPIHLAGEISDFNPEDYLETKGLKYLNRTTKLLMSATVLCLRDAGLKGADGSCAYGPDRMGAAVGTTHGILHSIGSFDRDTITEGWETVSPMAFANTVINAPAGHLAIREDIRGVTVTLSSGNCSALDAVGISIDYLLSHRVDCMLVAGAEELCEESMTLWSTDAIQGDVPGEAAIVLSLERVTDAGRRSATPLAKVLGYGNAFSTDSDTVSDAVRLSLEDAGIDASEIDHIVTGPEMDRHLGSLESLFGVLPSSSSVRSLFGDTFSAEGGIQLGAGIRLLKQGDTKTVLAISKDTHGTSSAVILGHIDAVPEAASASAD